MRMASSWTLLEPSITSPPNDLNNNNKPNTTTNSEQQQRKEALDNLAVTVWQFSRCLQSHLWPPSEDEIPFQTEVRARLNPERATACIVAEHRPSVGLSDLANAVEQLPIPFLKRIEIDRSVTMLGEMGGECEQIFDSPVPLVYTRCVYVFVCIFSVVDIDGGFMIA